MGALISGIGGYNEGNFQSQVDLLNKQFAQQAGSAALSQGAVEAGRLRAQGSQVLGTQKANYAASGVDTGTGTPVDVMADTRMMSSYDATLAKNNAARTAWGYNVQGFQYGLQSQLDKMKASTALMSGLAGAGTQAFSLASGMTG